MPIPKRNTIVVGGGLLGASIARALQKESSSHITWFLGKERKAASTDCNKIIRTTYPDEFYVKLAQDGLKLWQNDECFHHSGWVFATKKRIPNKRQSSSDTRVTVEEYQSMVGSARPPNLSAEEELWQNGNVGYADTAYALQLLKDEVTALGVDVIESDVLRILKDDQGNCRGVEVDASPPYEMVADRVVLSVGPWLPHLLRKSEVPYPEGIFRIVVLVVAILRLDDAEMKMLNMGMPISVGDEGEVIVSKRHNLLKLTTPRTFEVADVDELNDHHMACDTSANLAVLRKWFPQFGDRDVESWACPDLLTIDQRFIIDEAPHTKNLIIASGGSFHGAKFLPNFGGLVRRFLGQGEADDLFDEILRGCKWERLHGVKPVHPGVVPSAVNNQVNQVGGSHLA